MSDIDGVDTESNQTVRKDSGTGAKPPATADASRDEDAALPTFGEDAGLGDAAVGGGADASPQDAGRADAGRDSGTTPTLDGGTPTDGGTLAGPCAGVVINEIQTEGRGGASDEFVELYNPGASCGPVPLELVYRSATGTTDVVLGSWNLAMAQGSFLVFGGTGFGGVAAAKLGAGIAAAGGQLRLRTSGGVVLDSVGYGSARGAFVRGTPAPVQPTNGSIARRGGVDTQNNGVDFAKVVTPTPGASNP